MPLPFWTRRFGKSQIQICADAAEQNHWSECGRATSLANGEALARPHRSVPALGHESSFCVLCAFSRREIPVIRFERRETLDSSRAFRQSGLANVCQGN